MRRAYQQWLRVFLQLCRDGGPEVIPNVRPVSDEQAQDRVGWRLLQSHIQVQPSVRRARLPGLLPVLWSVYYNNYCRSRIVASAEAYSFLLNALWARQMLLLLSCFCFVLYLSLFSSPFSSFFYQYLVGVVLAAETGSWGDCVRAAGR